MATADGSGPAHGPERAGWPRRPPVTTMIAIGLVVVLGGVAGAQVVLRVPSADALGTVRAEEPVPGPAPTSTTVELTVDGPRPFGATFTVNVPELTPDHLRAEAVAGTPELQVCLELAGAITNGSLVARRPDGEVETYRLLGSWHAGRRELTAAFGSGSEIGTLSLRLQ